MVLESETESYVSVILGNGPASSVSRIGWIPHIIISSFLIVLILSLASISFLQFKISHQSMQPLNLLVPFLVLIMPRSARYHSESLILPFSKAKLFLHSLTLPVFTSFLSSLSPCGSLRGPDGSALGMASRISFKHSSLRLGPYQTTALQEIPTDGTSCAPPLLDS